MTASSSTPKVHTLDRREAVRLILGRRKGALVVAGLGAAAWDCAAAGETDDVFYLWGGMGLAASIGLGLALARTERRVLVITGDGEAMMGLGALAVIGAQQPANLAILVLDNEAFGETGHQPGLSAAGVDLARTASALGFRETAVAGNIDQLDAVANDLFDAIGPVLCVLKIHPGDAPKVLPERDGGALVRRFRRATARAD